MDDSNQQLMPEHIGVNKQKNILCLRPMFKIVSRNQSLAKLIVIPVFLKCFGMLLTANLLKESINL
jgi:hypothetical protein